LTNARTSADVQFALVPGCAVVGAAATAVGTLDVEGETCPPESVQALASGITATNAIHRRNRAVRALAELIGGAFRFTQSETIHH
jgi:hypothetical protein